MSLEREVEQVPDDRNLADDKVDDHIAKHGNENATWRANALRFNQQVCRGAERDYSTENRHKSQQRVKPEAPFRAGNAPAGIKQTR